MNLEKASSSKEREMKTVYVGINHRSHVNSNALLKNALFECSTSFFQYGPGHVSQETLEGGLEAFEKRRGFHNHRRRIFKSSNATAFG